MFLVVSFKRPDKMAAASLKVKPFNETQRNNRKRKKPGDSKYRMAFVIKSTQL